MAYLIVREPGRASMTVGLHDELIVGRDAEADLVLADRQVSRRHLALRAEVGGYRLVDLGSTHGTLVNGEVATDRRLADGDLVQIGNAVFAFHEGAATTEPSVIHTVTHIGEPRARRPDAESRRLRVLVDLGRALRALDDPDRVLGELLDAALEVLAADRGVAGLVEGAAAGRRIERARGGAAVPDGELMISHAVMEGLLVRREAMLVQPPGVRSALGAPLVGVQGALGYLYLEERRRPAPFAADDLDFLAALAELAGAALEQSQQHRRVLDWVDALRRADTAPPILGDSPPMRQVMDRVRRYAVAGDTTVLIRGETGTGKELVARTLHALSPRADGPFVAVNCAAIPDTMIESELFGHERGAFTGADRARRGSFAVARGGTLFLDEIGDLSSTAQAKVLRAIEEREIQPLGADHAVPIDLRILAATHRPLEDEVRAGRFRADLMYRIDVAEVELPPLRARGDDVVVLASAFLARGAARLGRIGARLAPAALTTLRRYDWPGNVRQLRNEIERALLLADGAEVDLDDLRRRLALVPAAEATPATATAAGAKPLTKMETSERTMVEVALREHGGNVMAAAKTLGVSRGTLYRKMEKYGLRED